MSDAPGKIFDLQTQPAKFLKKDLEPVQSKIKLSVAEKETAKLLKNNLNFFARSCLKIRDKAGNIVPFKFNSVQEFLDKKLNEQKLRTGKVRALILKGRQEGCSTYITARIFHRLIWTFGLQAGTLTHLADSTNKLFEKLDLFYKFSNIRPPLKRWYNKRHVEFGQVDSIWDFGTAGTDYVGRGGTIQILHLSECPFWDHPEEIVKGMLQSVPDMAGTEIIFESTANGMDPVFYKMCSQSLQGIGDYELIFIPWFWMPEYSRILTAPFEPMTDEIELKEVYGLTDEQLNWRRAKIQELGSEYAFKAEYPNNPQEAFQLAGEGSFIPPEDILRARKTKLDKEIYAASPLICGLDVSRIRDRTVFAFRKGPKLLKVLVYDPRKHEIREGSNVIGECGELKQDYLAGRAAWYIKTYGIDTMYIDCSEGHGQGIYERLCQEGFSRVVKAVMFGSGADDPVMYANKRAEMWGRFHRWIRREDGPVEIPDDDHIQADISSMPRPRNTANHRINMRDKDEIREKFGMSPDIGDAIVLTFAFLIPITHTKSQRFSLEKVNREKSGLVTMRKKRSQTSGTFFNPGNIFA